MGKLSHRNDPLKGTRQMPGVKAFTCMPNLPVQTFLIHVFVQIPQWELRGLELGRSWTINTLLSLSVSFSVLAQSWGNPTKGSEAVCLSQALLVASAMRAPQCDIPDGSFLAAWAQESEPQHRSMTKHTHWPSPSHQHRENWAQQAAAASGDSLKSKYSN